MRIKISGVDNVRRSLRRKAETGQSSLEAALYREGEEIMAKSKRITPVDTGNLRATGHVRPPERTGTQVFVRLGFGGPAAPYAVYVHEGTHLNFTVGQAKFLEEPIRRARRGFTKRIADRMRGDFR